ncbi:hypothetical protein [Dactylosporangium sp. CS-033363]|uniref:hypothetical protein n=1 Tax=Dactylosporangium sp. CS-033363 TaxID=3239935 RepID=UPI003D8C30F9
MDLKQAMQEATDSPPPTGIDVDRLIAGERRRGTSMRLAGFAAVVTVLAFAATLLPRYFGESLAPPPVVAASGDRTPAPPTPMTTPRTDFPTIPGLPSGMAGSIKEACAQTPSPGLAPPLHPVTEQCDRATGRLAATYGFQIEEMVTGVVGGVALRFVRDPAVSVGYYSGRDYDRDGHRFTVTVRVSASPGDQAQWAAGHPCAAGCSERTVGGTTLHITDGPVITAYRSDGTEITLTFAAKDGGGVPITEEQAVTLVTVPELTLYPTVS